MSNFVDEIKKTINGQIRQVNTCIPGVIVEYNAPFATVQPSVDMALPNGDKLEYPMIYGVPVIMPASFGGSVNITFPIKPGDGVAIFFAQDSIDDWAKGGVSSDTRKHSLTDAFCIIGLNNFALPTANANTLTINNNGSNIIVDKEKIEINSKDVTIGCTNYTINATKTKINIAGGGSLELDSGAIRITNADLIVDGISFKNHVHGGVTSGGATTSTPQ